jgi:transcription termination factor Rho
MAVLDRGELERSPLADLHAIAAELGVEGFRRLRREELVTAIVDHAGAGEEGDAAPGEAAPEDADAELAAGEDSGRRGRTGAARGRGRAAEAETPGTGDGGAAEAPEAPAARRRRGSGRDRVAADPERGEARVEESDQVVERGGRAPRAAEEEEAQGEHRSGVLDILPNGSGFLRVGTLVPSRDDVHVSPAQIRRCELRAGDEVGGPVRHPRRSERHPSLVHVETVNGAPAEPPAERPRFDELIPGYATERLAAPEELAGAPFGKGSRVAVLGPPGAEGGALLRRLAGLLTESHDGLSLTVALAGSRPEDVTEWRRSSSAVVGGGADAEGAEQARAAELALEQAKRVAERAGDAVLVIDSLEPLAPDAARRIFAAARRLEGAGSLTVIATVGASDELARLATTRIVVEPGTGPRGDQPPAVSAASDTVRADLLGS